MNPRIYCTKDAKGQHVFFVKAYGEQYCLFSQKYRTSVQARFAGGLALDKALSGVRNFAVCKTAEKILSAIRSLEREENIVLLDRKATKCGRNSAQDRQSGRPYRPDVEPVCFDEPWFEF